MAFRGCLAAGGAASALCLLLVAHAASAAPVLSPQLTSQLTGRAQGLNKLKLPQLSQVRSLQPLRGGEDLSGLPLASDDSLAAPSTGRVTLKFHINYGVEGGSIVCVGPSNSFGNGDIHKAPKLQRKGGEKWEGETKVHISEGVVKYQYVVLSKTHRYEARIAERSINVKGLQDGDVIDVQDAFRSPKPATLATSCFERAVFGKGLQDSTLATQNPEVEFSRFTWDTESGQVKVRFQLFAPRKEAGHSVWVEGKPSALGGWSDKRVKMAHIGRGIYVGQASLSSSDFPFEYKYAILDGNGKVACSEKKNRKLEIMTPGSSHVVRDEAFNYHTPIFKAAGVALPVSGIKTRQCTGIGEFADLKMMADWCAKAGLQLVQILPINDSGEDPSPYSAASSFALHPIYIRPKDVATYYSSRFGLDTGGLEGWASSLVEKLNGNWKIDYVKILDEKKKFMDGVFDQIGSKKVQEDPDFQQYVKDNEGWLTTYAAFKVQLMKEKQYNQKWFDCTKWSKPASETQSIVNPNGPEYDEVLRVYFTQYHLHVQLKEASLYCETKGVALKGDLPIGVTRCSQDVWAEPHLFKLDKNAGAPGDPEQNWGFPPYNWDNMHKDGCSWWRRRLQHMEKYFHAYRIDHVLGFFRMWEIPPHGGGYYYPNHGLRENGLRNLRAIQTASNMMICGEDLGNVPDEVGPVMLELGVLGLKLQRWCNGKTWEYGYLTVAASSCHDTSPCRLWWNEDWGGAEWFFQAFCGGGQTPGGPPDWVSQKIIKMHAQSSAMWTINPIQDYLDCYESLRSKNAKNDMINHPGQTDGCWQWRCHKRMEDLCNEDSFNNMLKKIMAEHERGKTY